MAKRKTANKRARDQLQGLKMSIHFRPAEIDDDFRLRGIEPSKGEPVMHGDKVMVLFRDGYIRDNRAFRKDSNINITFSIKTGNNSYSYTFGTAKVSLNAPLPYQNVVLLPPTKIEDHFSIFVIMIQESGLKLAQEKISKGITVADKLISNVPVVGDTGSKAIGIIGDAVNLMVALSPEHALLHEGNTYIVDESRYPGIIDKNRYPDSGLDYLRLGTFDFYEDGYEYKDGKYIENRTGREGKPNRVTIELIKPNSKDEPTS